MEIKAHKGLGFGGLGFGGLGVRLLGLSGCEESKVGWYHLVRPATLEIFIENEDT